MYLLFGILVCLDAHLPGPRGRGEELELPTGWETLTALGDGEGGGEGDFCILINFEKKKRNQNFKFLKY